MSQDTLEDLKVIIVTHVYTSGPGQDFEEFLNTKLVKKVLFIGHPLFFNKNLSGSSYRICEYGKLVKEHKTTIKDIPILLEYLLDSFKTIYYVLIQKEKWDLFVGCNCLNAAVGVILQRLGIVNRSIYYVIDYTPKRFPNPLINYIYHKIDRFSVKYSFRTWNLSPRMIEGRNRFFNIPTGKQIVLPLGVWYDRIPRCNFNEIYKYTLVFMGHVLKKQGIQYVIEAIPIIIKAIPEFKFLVVGGGEYLDEIKKLTNATKMDKYVTFTGKIEKHEDLEKILAKCAVAVAPYETNLAKLDASDNFTYYADPSKIKVYLACGLPVLLTDVSYNAQVIQAKKCGRIITNNPNEIAHAVIELMNDSSVLEQYRNNAIEFAQSFNWNTIFSNELKDILSCK